MFVGAVRDDGLRVFLKVVGRKETIFGGDEGFEVAPCCARDLAQNFCVRLD
jgi:hypothetical protein